VAAKEVVSSNEKIKGRKKRRKKWKKKHKNKTKG
jgi:hypothetical protein